jgi:hypothetical protein
MEKKNYPDKFVTKYKINYFNFNDLHFIRYGSVKCGTCKNSF